MIKQQLKSQLRRHFTLLSIVRGQEYYADDLVQAVRVSESQASAFVRGSKEYRVVLEWGRTGRIGALCSCAHFAEGHFCKHLWAFIMELDSRRDVSLPFPRGRAFELERIEHQDKFLLADDLRDSANNWRNMFKPESKSVSHEVGLSSRQEDIFIVLSKDKSYEPGVRLQFYMANMVSPGVVGDVLALNIQQNGEVRIGSTRMQAIFRSIATVSLGQMRLSRSSGYRYYGDANSRVLKGSALKLILRDLLGTGRVYCQVDDFKKSTAENVDLSLRYVQFEDLHMSVSEQEDGYGIEGKVRAIGDRSQSVETVKLHELRLLAEDVYQFGQNLGVLQVSEEETAWFNELTHSALSVSKADEEAFLEAILNQKIKIELPDKLKWSEATVIPQARIELICDKKGDHRKYRVNVKFNYGSRAVYYEQPLIKLPSEEEKKVYLRNFEYENRIISGLPDFLCTVRPSDDVRLLPLQNLAEFVKNVFAQGLPVTVESKKVESEHSFKFSVSSGVDWFDVQGEASFSGKWVKVPAILEAVAKGEKFVPLEDGTLGLITDEMSRRLEKLGTFAQKSGDSLRFTSAQGLLLNSLMEDEGNLQLDNSFQKLKAKIKGFSGILPAHPSKNFRGSLRTYQREGLGWLEFLQDFGLGGILADDMGLGKTIQCLAFLEKRREKDQSCPPSLLIVPKSLLENWKNEAARFTPDLKVLIYAGLTRRASGVDQFKDFDIVVCTYQTMLRDGEIFKNCQWDCLIADEAQAIKNPEALISKAIKSIPARFRLAMTGTPIENSIHDLFSISDFVNPGFLNGKKQSASLKVSDETRELLAKAFKPVVLRRTKDQVLKDLPEKIEQMISVELEPKQQKIYNELKRYYQAKLLKEVEEKGIKGSQIQILAALTRLRQAALHPGLLSEDHAKVKSSKFEVVLEMLEEIIAEGHRVLVFSQFTSLLALLKEELKAKQIEFSYLDGQTKKRQESVDSFKKSEVPVFLISLKAGGVGLNLVEADYVFLLDPWWNPAVEAQAIDRVHRIGQKRSVNAYRFIAKNTVEEKILELQKSKKLLSDDILGQKTSPLKGLTVQDIESIFS